MGIQQGPISRDTLMERLASARKVINKVESGDYTKGNIDTSNLIDDNEDKAIYNVNYDDNIIFSDVSTNMKPANSGEVDIERINKSKLPDAIKQAMIENPIPQISLNDSLDMDFVKRTKKIMEQEGISSKPIAKPSAQKITTSINNTELTALLTPIIENIIRKSLDEIVEKKINQILSAQQSSTINENIILKVGESVFKGKITTISKSK